MLVLQCSRDHPVRTLYRRMSVSWERVLAKAKAKAKKEEKHKERTRANQKDRRHEPNKGQGKGKKQGEYSAPATAERRSRPQRVAEVDAQQTDENEPGLRASRSLQASQLRVMQHVGNKIRVHGLRHVPLRTPEGQSVIIPFVVRDVARPVVFLGKLRRKGYRIVMDEKSFLQHPSGERIPLKLRNNTWCISAETEREDELVAPLSVGDMWDFPEKQKEMEDSEAWQRIPMRFRAAVGGAVPEDPGRAAADDPNEQAALRFNATRTKAELWARLTSLELRKRREQRRAAQLEERAAHLSAGRVLFAPVLLPTRSHASGNCGTQCHSLSDDAMV
eukprot:268573-Amphidinium_carterae.2